MTQIMQTLKNFKCFFTILGHFGPSLSYVFEYDGFNKQI